MTKKSLIKLFIVITFALMLFYFIIGRVSGFSSYVKNNLDKNISVEIEHPDGTVNYYDSNEFPLVNRGDTIYATVNLPKDRYIKDSAICFYTYHSVIDVYDNNDNLLYTYGSKQAQKGAMIGGTYVFVHIPEEAWGNFLTIKLDVQENRAFSNLQEVMVLDSIDSYKYLIGNKEAELLIFLAILIISIITLIVLVLEGRWTPIIRQWVYLLSFLALVSLWLLEYNGMLNIFTDNKIFTGNVEYIALFISPIMLVMFFYEQKKNPKLKKVNLCLALIYGVFAVTCILLNYTTLNYHYNKMLTLFHVLLLIGIIIEVIIIFRSEKKNILSLQALKYGAVAYFILLFLEITRYYLYRRANYYMLVLTQNFMSIAVIVLIISIILSYVVQLADHYIGEYEKNNLKKLAYYDALTGIPNRAGCYKYFENLDPSKENAIVFIDANNLKYANDVFGHEMGDKLIKFIAEALETAFEKDGFYGRFGGDEFVAGISYKKVEKIYECMHTFNTIIYHANKEKQFPFTVSVSYGVSISSKDNPMSIDELIRSADEKMYIHKKKKKQLLDNMKKRELLENKDSIKSV